MEAEEEKIVGHAKEAIHTLTDKKKNWKEKIGGFLWEILIIVIAVNLTIGFHNWNEKRHERELEKEFLIGTRNDLDNVRQNLNSGIQGSQPTLDYYDSVWVQINEHRIDKVFTDNNSWQLLNNWLFTYDNSRFENFKSSGYLRLIENNKLLKSITFLYTVSLPFQAETDKRTNEERRHDFITYIGSKVRTDSSGKMYVSEILSNPEVKFQILIRKIFLNERKWQKQQLAQEVGNAINLIDKELKDSFDYEFKE